MNDLHHLAGAYSVNALDDEERRMFEAHYPDCDVCRIEVAEFQETIGQMAEAAGVPVPPELKARVMAEVSASRQLPVASENVIDLTERRKSFIDRSRVLSLVGAVLIVAGLSLVILRLGGNSPVEDLLAAPDAVTTQLEGGSGSIRVIWSAERDQALVIGDDLPAVAADQIYELWLLLPDDRGVTPAGLFRPEAGSVFTLINVADEPGIGWGVTVEPAGGSLTPTGEIIFQGTV